MLVCDRCGGRHQILGANFAWVSTVPDSLFNVVDFDSNAGAGALTGTVVPSADPTLTDWVPLQGVLFFEPVVDTSFVPAMPTFLDARLDWWAVRDTGGALQAGITIGWEEVEFFNGVNVPEPASLGLAASGLVAFSGRDCHA